MDSKIKENFNEKNDCNLEEINGGVVGWGIVGVVAGAVSFAGGYGLAYWLG